MHIPGRLLLAYAERGDLVEVVSNRVARLTGHWSDGLIAGGRCNPTAARMPWAGFGRTASLGTR